MFLNFLWVQNNPKKKTLVQQSGLYLIRELSYDHFTLRLIVHILFDELTMLIIIHEGES
jgi:hypothetical protein